MKKFVLVLGGCGFLGRELSLYLLRSDYHVVSISRRKTSLRHSRLTHICLDLSLEESFQSIPRHQYVSCFYLIGHSSVLLTPPTASQDLSVLTFTSTKILSIISECSPLCRFFYASSAAVYGQPLHYPITESTEVRPISMYGYNKHINETAVQYYSNHFGIRSTALRIFSAYGPTLHRQFIWDITKKITKAHDSGTSYFNVWGTGKETRDFIFVSDVAKSLAILSQTQDVMPSHINIASGTNHTIESVVFLILRLLGRQHLSPVFDGIGKQEYPSNWSVDIGLLRSYGFCPDYDISQGLRLTLPHFVASL